MTVERRRVLVVLVVAVVLAACAVGYAVISSVPDYRTTVLVDASAPGAEFPAIASAVGATAHNAGGDDSLSLRRFGGTCGAADNTSEVADDASTIPGAVAALTPSGQATLLSGVLAAIDDFSGLYPFRGSVRNRIVVVSSTGLDACSQDQAEVSRAIQEHVRAAGLRLDLRIVGHRVPAEQHEALKQVAVPESVTFTASPEELTAVLHELVVPESPEAALIDVTTSAPAAQPVYAFTSKTRLGVVRGDQVIAEAPGEYAKYGGDGGPWITADGRFAFAVEASGLVAIDVTAGTNRVITCDDCLTAVPVGGSHIAWLDRQATLVLLDLGTPDARPERARATLPDRGGADPAANPFALPPKLLAGTDGAVLVAVADSPSAYGGPEDLYLIDVDGPVTALGGTDANVTTGPGVVSPDRRTVAFRKTLHSGACQEISSVTLVDVATGAHRTPLVNGVLGGPPDVDGSGVSDLWFDDDGGLNAIYSSWRCADSGGASTPVQPSTRWRLDGDRWSAPAADAVLTTRPVAPGVRAVVADIDPRAHTGTLYTETGGRRAKVADQVVAIAVRG